MNETKRQRIEKAQFFRKALQTALAKISKTTGVALQRLRRDAAFEAFTLRVATRGFFILKGAHALELRCRELDELTRLARSTKDLDFLARIEIPEEIISAHNTHEGIEQFIVRKLQALSASPVDESDRFEFIVNGTVKHLETQGSAFGFRIEVECRLGQDNWEKFLLDVVLGDAFISDIDEIKTGRLLANVGVGTGTIQVISIAQHFAEKLHAYTFPRSEGENTRTKDLIDMVTLICRHKVSCEACINAIKIVFEHRGTHTLPAELPIPPESWRIRWPALAKDASIDMSIDEAFNIVSDFVKRCRLGSNQ